MAKNNKSTPNELDYYSLMNQITEEEYNSFIDLISNALDIENLPENVLKDWVVQSLLKAGRVGVYKLSNDELWLPATSDGVLDEMGNPKGYLLKTANGKIITVKSNSSILAFY